MAQAALAWIAAQGIIALPGTTRPDRLFENWTSRDLELTDEDLKEMRTLADSLKPQGNRYNEVAAKAIGN
jgi:diketogulonate reductase-like aldo/keto reductase